MKLAMVSHVAPVPATAGQNQRVRYTLEALRQEFEVTLITSAVNLERHPDTADHADAVIPVGPAVRSTLRRATELVAGTSFALRTGLKRSNYHIGRLFDPTALAEVIDPTEFDLAFFHYWHGVDAVPFFQQAGTPAVLDMHDILWRARGSQLEQRRFVPGAVAARQQRRYREAEEAAWAQFDGIVAINRAESDEVRTLLGRDATVWYVPMGVHLQAWPYLHEPAATPRIAFYGGLNTRARELTAVQCATEIMPLIWEQQPECELWIIGANPTDRVRALDQLDRVTVTGFVDEPGSLLATMWAVLCPFSGRFGFRSRLVEVMACGVPIVATSDAVYGMDLDDEAAVLLHETSPGMADACVELIEDRSGTIERGLRARNLAERFSFDATYGALARHLAGFAAGRAPD